MSSNSNKVLLWQFSKISLQQLLYIFDQLYKFVELINVAYVLEFQGI